MPIVYLAPDPINSTQLIPGGVVPAVGGKLFHYLAGTSTKTDVYVDNTGTTKWANPIVLDSGGNLGGSNEVWIPAGVSVKFVLAPFNDTDPPIAPYKTWDNLSGINDATSILTEWIPGPAPTFVSATSFTLAGDQTANFTPGRRVKTTNTAGTRYGTISTSVFGAVTTVTITNDSGTLDSGLSAVWYALINPKNTSLPLIVSVLNFGAVGDGVTDDRVGIQAWIADISATGKFGYVPAGTYILTKGAAQTDEAGTIYPCLTMASNMHIWAEPGATFKLADNQSTDAAVLPLGMFFSNSVLSNISIKNLTIDMNGANNKISPSRGVGTYALHNMAHISFSGTPAGVAARADDVLLDNCKFINTPGVSSVIMAQSNTNSITLGKRWTIRNCLFNNHGLDTNDHSDIFGWANDVLIDGNTATADTMWGTVGSVGGVCFHEVHGANHRVVNNRVNNYFQGFWMAANQTSASESCIFEGNTITVAATGIDFGRENVNMQAVRNVHVADNIITLTNDDIAPLAIRSAFSCEANYAITDVTMDGNEIYTTDTTVGAVAFYINPSTTAAQVNKDWRFINNKVKGLAIGVLMKSNATNNLGNIEVGYNQFYNLDGVGGFGTAAGIAYTSAAGNIGQLTIQPNTFIDDTGGAAYDNGILLTTGTISNLFVAPQSYRGLAANYTESSLTVTTRRGYYSGTWTVTLTSFTIVGAAPVVVGTYTRKGSFVHIDVSIDPDTSIACVAGTSLFNLPFPPSVIATDVTAANTTTFVGATTTGFIPLTDPGQCYPPAWAATANTMVVSGDYLTADVG